MNPTPSNARTSSNDSTTDTGKARAFSQLDVFSGVALRGNPLAVVHDARGLDDARMAAFANWTNLSETTFLLPPSHPDADYRVRIFTPAGELAFAGHPTLGSCAAFLHAGGEPKDAQLIVQECRVGLVRIRRDGKRLAFAAPPVQFSQPTALELERICAALGIAQSSVRAQQWVDNGVRMFALLLHDAASVLAIEPDHAALKTLANVGLIGPQAAGADSDYEVRAFANLAGIPEDPVTGSLNAMLAQWLMSIDVAPPAYVARQGTRLGRAGRVTIERIDGDIWVGGEVTRCIEGTLTL